MSLAVVGPTGCGKTVGFAIPALLEWRGPVIATSVKADLVTASLEHRRACGDVWIYDPTSFVGRDTGHLVATRRLRHVVRRDQDVSVAVRRSAATSRLRQ